MTRAVAALLGALMGVTILALTFGATYWFLGKTALIGVLTWHWLPGVVVAVNGVVVAVLLALGAFRHKRDDREPSEGSRRLLSASERFRWQVERGDKG